MLKKKDSSLNWNLRRPRTPEDLADVKRFVAKECEGKNYFVFSRFTANSFLKEGFRTQKIGISAGHPNSDRYHLFTYNWTYTDFDGDEGEDPKFWIRVRERRDYDYNLTFNRGRYAVGYPHLTLEAGVYKTEKVLIERERVDHNGKRIGYEDPIRYSSSIGAVLMEPGYPVSYDTFLPLIRPIFDEKAARWSRAVEKLTNAAWTVNFLSEYVAKIFKK